MAKQKKTDTPTKAAPSTGFLQIYKPGQGYYVRMGTAVGSGVLTLLGCHFLYKKLSGFSFFPDANYDLLVQVGIPVVVFIALALTVFRVLNHRRIADFMIATEGEMKKVNWTSKREIFGSTKVVIVMVLILGAMLAAIDTVFMWFFRTIGVLQF